MHELLITAFSYFKEEISWDTKGFKHSDQARTCSFGYYNISKCILDNIRAVHFISKFWSPNPVLDQGKFQELKTITVSQQKIVLQMQINIQNVAKCLRHISIKQDTNVYCASTLNLPIFWKLCPIFWIILNICVRLGCP